MTKIILLLILFFLLFSTFFINQVRADKPDLSTVIMPKREYLLPTDSIEFDVYFSGNGKVNNSKITCYTEEYFGVSIQIQGGRKSPGERFGWNVITPFDQIINSYFEPDFKIINSEVQPAPITIELSNPKNRDGDHKISCVLTYQDLDGNWYTSSSEQVFHIQTSQDRLWLTTENLVILLALTSLIISVTSLIISLLVRKEKQKN
jgi:hypothetical protein